MPSYKFVVEATIDLETEVEAESLEEAIEIAKARDVRDRCYDCSVVVPTYWCSRYDASAKGARLSEVSIDGQSDIDASAAAEEMW